MSRLLQPGRENGSADPRLVGKRVEAPRSMQRQLRRMTRLIIAKMFDRLGERAVIAFSPTPRLSYDVHGEVRRSSFLRQNCMPA
jgi:hypothetical protein